MTFGRAEQARYQDHIVPIFGDFLKKCYSMSFLSFWRVFLTRLPGKEDCLEFALREDNAEVVGVENVDFPSASDGISSRDKPLAGNVFPPNLEGIGADAVGIFPTPLSPRAFSPAPLPTPNPPIAALYPPDELPQTDDLTESDKDLTSTSTLADPNAAQASSTQQRLQPKQGLGEIVPADEAANGRRSKRRWVLNMDPIKEAPLKSSSAASTNHKKGHTSSQTGTMPSTSPPNWFIESQQMFAEQNLGKEWEALLASWASFEQRGGYTEVRRLKTVSRPDAVHVWIKSGRSMTCRPHIPNLKTYEAEFIAWWTNLQPSWRVVRGKVKSDLTQEDWECLRLPGANGITSAVAGLFFWGLGVQGQVGPRKAWLTAVQDCQLVLSVL